MKIEQLTLQTYVPRSLYLFYTKTLGLEGEHFDDGCFNITVGQSILRFKPCLSRVYYHFAFNIPSNQFESALAWLQERVEVLPNEEGELLVNFSNWNAFAIYFYDPAGNIVELIARKDLPQANSSVFDAGQILSISEVGLPVQTVKAASDKIMESAGLPFYSGNHKTFNAIGDPEGLFIVVDEEEKNWYPTSKIAQPNPVEVDFWEQGKRYNLQLSPEGLDVLPASGNPQ